MDKTLHTLTTPNPNYEGDRIHGHVHFHDGRAMVEDTLEVYYDTGEGQGDSAVTHPKPYNVIALLVAEGCTDLGPIYTNLAEATAGPAPTPAPGPRLAPFNPDRKE